MQLLAKALVPLELLARLQSLGQVVPPVGLAHPGAEDVPQVGPRDRVLFEARLANLLSKKLRVEIVLRSVPVSGRLDGARECRGASHVDFAVVGPSQHVGQQYLFPCMQLEVQTFVHLLLVWVGRVWVFHKVSVERHLDQPTPDPV